MEEGEHNEEHEDSVIFTPDAIIYPYAMVIKVRGATVAYPAMFTIQVAETLTILAVTILVVVGLEFDALVILVPFIEVNHRIRGV